MRGVTVDGRVAGASGMQDIMSPFSSETSNKVNTKYNNFDCPACIV